MKEFHGCIGEKMMAFFNVYIRTCTYMYKNVSLSLSLSPKFILDIYFFLDMLLDLSDLLQVRKWLHHGAYSNTHQYMLY